MKSQRLSKAKRTLILISSSILLTLLMIYRNLTVSPFEGFRIAAVTFTERTQSCSGKFSGTQHDDLLGGLLGTGFDNHSCISRYESLQYRKPSVHSPSPYLISKLRNYEKLHSRCGPYSASYNETVTELKTGGVKRAANARTDCKYIVWLPQCGLGNRIISMTSAFLYAVLTDRVLLVEHGPDMSNIFCEPFPNTSWLLPIDFPLRNNFSEFNKKYENTFGNVMRRKGGNYSELLFVNVHLLHDYDFHDMSFFCDQNQALVNHIPWLIMVSDEYFVPSLFTMPVFQDKLNKLFPDKETVFHHLSRYLFHSSNQVWGIITRFYDSYLANADERVGIQIRVFDPNRTPFMSIKDQIMSCTMKHKLLPEIDVNTLASASASASALGNKTSKAILITSLYPEYYETIRTMYLEHSTLTGEVISVYQPSHEVKQVFGSNMHNIKAWAEMNLLSMSDVLVTSSWSTFGYVAQGIGGLKPWILSKPENGTSPNPACQRGISMEPCFHSPPVYECKAKIKFDIGTLVPHVKHCEDRTKGVKLFNQ